MVRPAQYVSAEGSGNDVPATRRSAPFRSADSGDVNGLDGGGGSGQQVGFEDTRQRVCRIGDSVLFVVSCVCSLVLIVRFFLRWDVSVHSTNATQWSMVKATFLLGIEIGVLAMTGLLVFLVPRMVMTWTTTIVFEYMFGKGIHERQVLIRDGRKLARELSIGILTSVVKEGNMVAGAVVIFGLLAISKNMLCRSHPISPYCG